MVHAMTIDEQMILIWQDAVAEFWQSAATTFAAFAAAFFAVWFVAKMLPFFCMVWDFLKCWKWAKVLVLVFVCGMGYYGATKNAGILARVIFQYTDIESRYIVDNGSFVTNDYVHIDFNRYVAPGSGELRIDYYPLDTAQEDIADVAENLVSTTFDEFPVPADIAFENATNYHFVVYTTWTPGPSVHTNGVLQLIGRQDMAGTGYFVPSRTGIYEDGVKIAPSNIVIEADLSLPPLQSQQGEDQ